MENASKALLIAGSVLLGIIVLSLFLIMINSLTDYQQSQVQNQRDAEVVAFNNQYTGYMRSDVSGADIMSLINKVVFYNRTKSSAGIGDTGENYEYEPIVLCIDMNGNQKSLSMDGTTNKVFKSTTPYRFDATTNLQSTESGGFGTLNTLLNNTKIPAPPTSGAGLDQLTPEYRTRGDLNLYYTEGMLKGLLDNKNSTESIFDSKNRTNIESFADFNLIIGKIFFPLYNDAGKTISAETLGKWWDDYFGVNSFGVDTANKKSSSGRTIREELSYYYEYVQFQRGIFEYVQPTAADERSNPTFSTNTGRIIYMKFKFTGKFL